MFDFSPTHYTLIIIFVVLIIHIYDTEALICINVHKFIDKYLRVHLFILSLSVYYTLNKNIFVLLFIFLTNQIKSKANEFFKKIVLRFNLGIIFLYYIHTYNRSIWYSLYSNQTKLHYIHKIM